MQRELTVSRLNAYIAGVFDDESVLHGISVRGEVTECRIAGSRTFITLSEGGCTLSCVAFTAVDGITVGVEAVLIGSVSFHKKSGKTSFIAENVIVTDKRGAMLAELMKLKEKLAAEGLFADRPAFPSFIRKAALVTSNGGAVLHDMISVISAKDPCMDLCVYDVRVQGENSAATIAEALRDINQHCLDVDVIVVARGGGSAADLQSYNTETVARAVATSRIPVVSAVGHETDYTLCDLCASARAGTPSIAADMICEPYMRFSSAVENAARSAESAIKRIYIREKQRILLSAMRVISLNEIMLNDKKRKIGGIINKIGAKTENIAADVAQRLAADSSALDKLSPLAVLSKGYVKLSKNGHSVCSVKDVSKGDELTAIVRDGKFEVKVI